MTFKSSLIAEEEDVARPQTLRRSISVSRQAWREGRAASPLPAGAWKQSGPREEEWVECGSSDVGEEGASSAITTQMVAGAFPVTDAGAGAGRRREVSLFRGDGKACGGSCVCFELRGRRSKPCFAFGRLRRNCGARNPSAGISKTDLM